MMGICISLVTMTINSSDEKVSKSEMDIWNSSSSVSIGQTVDIFTVVKPSL